jgi:hypothetical protein
LDGAILAVGDGWGLLSTPRLPARPHLTMGGYPQPAPCPVWLAWVIHRYPCVQPVDTVEHLCGTLGANTRLCDVRHSVTIVTWIVPIV